MRVAEPEDLFSGEDILRSFLWRTFLVQSTGIRGFQQIVPSETRTLSDSSKKLIACRLVWVKNRVHVSKYFGDEERFHNGLTAGAEITFFFKKTLDLPLRVCYLPEFISLIPCGIFIMCPQIKTGFPYSSPDHIQ